MAAAAGALGWQIFRIFQPSERQPPNVPKGSTLDVSSLADLAPGSSSPLVFAGRPAILLRTATGDLVAFDAICTHRSCTVRFQSDVGQFVCPCHQGRYDANGVPRSGPPKEPLARYEIVRDGNRLIMVANG